MKSPGPRRPEQTTPVADCIRKINRLSPGPRWFIRCVSVSESLISSWPFVRAGYQQGQFFSHDGSNRNHESGKFLEVKVTGKLTRIEFYQAFAPRVDALIRQNGKIRILIVMHDFHGWTLGRFGRT